MKVFYFTFTLMCAYVFLSMAVESLEDKAFKSNSVILMISLAGIIFFSLKLF